jgi:hypothetical protein
VFQVDVHGGSEEFGRLSLTFTKGMLLQGGNALRRPVERCHRSVGVFHEQLREIERDIVEYRLVQSIGRAALIARSDLHFLRPGNRRCRTASKYVDSRLMLYPRL